MRPSLIVPVLVAIGLSAACGTPTSSGSSPASVSTAATSSPPPVASSAAPSVVASELTCTDFDFAAPRLATQVKHIGGFVGVSEGESDVQVNLDQAGYEMDVLMAKAADCAPKAVRAMDALAAAVDTLLITFTTGDDAAAVAADKAALADVRDRGIAAWKVLGINPVGWEGVFPNAR